MARSNVLWQSLVLRHTVSFLTQYMHISSSPALKISRVCRYLYGVISYVPLDHCFIIPEPYNSVWIDQFAVLSPAACQGLFRTIGCTFLHRNHAFFLICYKSFSASEHSLQNPSSPFVHGSSGNAIVASQLSLSSPSSLAGSLCSTF